MYHDRHLQNQHLLRGESFMKFSRIVLPLTLMALFLAWATIAAAQDPDDGPAGADPPLWAMRSNIAPSNIADGTVIDITGNLVAVQRGDNRTIRVVELKSGVPADVQPGVTVHAEGEVSGSVIEAQTIQVTGGTPWPDPSTPTQPSHEIDHVIFLIQEIIHSTTISGLTPAPRECANLESDALRGRLYVNHSVPFQLSAYSRHGHASRVAKLAMDSGKMDNFVIAEQSADTMGYYNRNDLPNYYAYADHFSLADRFFSSLTGPSLPNHLYTVAAQSGGIVDNLSQPPSGGFNFPTLAELLAESNISWKYYDGSEPKAFGLWNPLPGFTNFMDNADLMSHLVINTQYFQDLRDGNLPSVCWIIPNGIESEHPPENLHLGMWYVTTCVNALMKSPYWQNSVLVITWDDYGGFYDHVAPPSVDKYGYGPEFLR